MKLEKQNIGWDKDGILTVTNALGTIKITNEGLHMINKYGDTLIADDKGYSCQFNSPTYEELYEHWLKTKQND